MVLIMLFLFSGTPAHYPFQTYFAMLLCVSVFALSITVLPCATQQAEHKETPFDGLVTQDQDPNTEHLTFYKLPIPVLDNTSFVRYPNVITIHMRACSVTYVKSGTFDTLWRLHVVKFEYNQIIEFPENFGLASQSLVEMKLWGAFSLRTLPPFYFRNFPKLTKLNLGNNDWTPFDTSILPASLTNINLKYSFRLPTFPNFTSWTPDLKLISIAGNIIPEIPQDNIRNMKITYLNIHSNRLTSIPDYTRYPYIEVLLLHDNRLTTIPDFYNTTLTQLSLSNNPLVCDNTLCWIRMWPWMFNTPLLTDAPTCASPTRATGTPLMENRPIHMECFSGKIAVYHHKMVYCHEYP